MSWWKLNIIHQRNTGAEIKVCTVKLNIINKITNKISEMET